MVQRSLHVNNHSVRLQYRLTEYHTHSTMIGFRLIPENAKNKILYNNITSLVGFVYVRCIIIIGRKSQVVIIRFGDDDGTQSTILYTCTLNYIIPGYIPTTFPMVTGIHRNPIIHLCPCTHTRIKRSCGVYDCVSVCLMCF